MNDLPIWIIALVVIGGLMLAGPVVMALCWPVLPPRKWTEEDELDWRENQK